MSKQQHSYNSARIRRAGTSYGSDPAVVAVPRPARKQKKVGKTLLTIFIALVLTAVIALGGVYLYVNGLLNPGSFGKISPGGGTYIPKSYSKKDVIHLLIIGIDNEEERNYADGLGLTDMILYLQYDLKSNQLNMLQIPRDSYVGEQYATGGSGKINALLNSGPNKENPINNLATAIGEMFQLPIDHYIAIDMDGFKTIVDILGPLRVYVPQDMSHAGSALSKGWQWLDGNSAEFFVRNRYGSGFERSDIDRLDNQRHFYSALFRRFLNLAPQDIVKLLPVFEHYCNTDIQITDLFDIAYSALKLKSDNVMLCKIPGATGPELDPTGKNRSMFFMDAYGRGTEEEPGLAALLNQYFRAYAEDVDASELKLPLKIPSGYTLYPPNVQFMGQVQDEEGGGNIDVEPKA